MFQKVTNYTSGGDIGRFYLDFFFGLIYCMRCACIRKNNCFLHKHALVAVGSAIYG